MREGNHILGVYACDTERPPMAIRYLVDPDVPGAEVIISRDGRKYEVCWTRLNQTCGRYCMRCTLFNDVQ